LILVVFNGAISNAKIIKLQVKLEDNHEWQVRKNLDRGGLAVILQIVLVPALRGLEKPWRSLVTIVSYKVEYKLRVYSCVILLSREDWI
jgi:hypothetical protein